MLLSRLIPCLLIHRGGLAKTVRFKDPIYVGDPLNAVRIFNEKQVDELIVADIDASREGREPNYQLIADLAGECRMPLCYAGGITSSAQVEKIISLGVEKIGISSAAVKAPNLIAESASRVGNQSIVVVMDVKRTGLVQKKYELFIHNATINTRINPFEFAKRAQDLGAGEILVNAIDQDGVMQGYDIELIEGVRASVDTPLTVLGGAGTYDDLKGLVNRFGIIGAAAGSLFVFKGKYRAVLIQYPDSLAKEVIFSALEPEASDPSRQHTRKYSLKTNFPRVS
jgi:imidazole glycerol-phosphate synthase subunit HisF